MTMIAFFHQDAWMILRVPLFRVLFHGHWFLLQTTCTGAVWTPGGAVEGQWIKAGQIEAVGLDVRVSQQESWEHDFYWY